MASTINALTGSGGVATTADSSGVLDLQSAGTTIATVSSAGIAMASGKTLTGDAISSGKILQVLQTTKTDTFSTTTAIPSFTNITGVSATITPSATDSKILVMVSGGISNSSSGYTGGVNLLRDSTSIYLGDTRGSATRSSAWALTKTSGRCNMFSITYVDSPSTTSAITYYLQAGTESGGTIVIGGTSASGGSYNGSFPTNIILMEVSA